MIPHEIIEARMKLLNENMKNLLKVSYLQRDTTRISAIQKALNFWESINKEERD